MVCFEIPTETRSVWHQNSSISYWCDSSHSPKVCSFGENIQVWEVQDLSVSISRAICHGMFPQVWPHVGAPGEPKSVFIYFPGVLCDLLSRLEVPLCASVWWVGRVCLRMPPVPVKEQAWWAQENRRKKRQKFIITWRKSIPGDFLLYMVTGGNTL